MFFLFLKGGNKGNMFRAPNDDESTLHAMTVFLKSIWCFVTHHTRLYIIGLQLSISNLSTSHDKGPFGKQTIVNIVMALLTLPELHLIILLFFLK